MYKELFKEEKQLWFLASHNIKKKIYDEILKKTRDQSLILAQKRKNTSIFGKIIFYVTAMIKRGD